MRCWRPFRNLRAKGTVKTLGSGRRGQGGGGIGPEQLSEPGPKLAVDDQIAEIPGALDLRHVDAARRTVGPALLQAQDTTHSCLPAGETPDRSYPDRYVTPK